MKIQKKPKKRQTSFVKNALMYAQKNYLLLSVVGCVVLVGLVSAYKATVSKPNYVYAKVRVGQGYWWATTQPPSTWLVEAIQAAKEQKDLVGKPIAQILRVDYYPYYGTSQFNTYVTLRLKVSKNGSKGSYSFNRETIGIASPIDLEFSNVQFSGTIIELSEKPIVTKLIPKTIYLTKKYSYPWEFDEVKIGDKFNNGNEDVLEVLDKAKGETNEVFINEQGKLVSTTTESYNYIILKLKVLVREEGPRYIYGEEIILSPVRGFDFITNGYVYNNYVISRIE